MTHNPTLRNPWCGEPLTDFVIDAGTCKRPKGHWGIHWFKPASSDPHPDECVNPKAHHRWEDCYAT